MILAAIEASPFLLKFVVLATLVVGVGFLLRLLKQPHVIIYIVIGVIMGPSVLKFTDDTQLVTELGSLGLVLMLFFIGMEIELNQLVMNWRVSVLGTVLQVLLSVALAFAIGAFLNWPLARIVTIGFVISLSSTTVVLKLLQSDNELDSLHGQTALGILLVQDILIVPMLIILGYLGGETPTGAAISLQVSGGVLIIGFLIYIARGGTVKIPFSDMIDNDHELQIFFSFLICFGLAALTGFMGLSTALGSFVAGILVSSAKATHWFHDSLHSLRVVFVALFFISIGMLIDLQFIVNNAALVAGIVFGVFLLNSAINIFVLRVFKYTWATSFYTGALLSQIGEFSFIIGAAAYFTGIITDFAYQIIVSAISLSLLLSSFWVRFSHRLYERAMQSLSSPPAKGS